MQTEVVGIGFNDNIKVYNFAPNGIRLKRGDKVVVDTERGYELGCVLVESKQIDESELIGELKKVIRLATKGDIETHTHNMADGLAGLPRAKDIAENICPSMKVTRLEYTLDRSKMIVTYTSDERVDYRELVKHLAAHFHARIEMRQIGNRDEVAAIGAMGPCGRVCCCKKFLTDFDKVSIKMAKQQGLALNPNKINGMCGRLFCCLKYEDEFYRDATAKMPKMNSIVRTPDGSGKVVFNDIMHDKVTVQIVINDNITRNVYNLADISFDNKVQAISPKANGDESDED